jgi:phosphomevalonate kinase
VIDVSSAVMGAIDYQRFDPPNGSKLSILLDQLRSETEVDPNPWTA